MHNTLIIGADKTAILDSVGSSNFLFIDDGPLIDELAIPSRRKVTRFDVKTHHFNPLHEMDYKRAREFVAVIDAIFPVHTTSSCGRRWHSYEASGPLTGT
jgi:hypothetical protein